jgi:hypothetical protein
VRIDGERRDDHANDDDAEGDGDPWHHPSARARLAALKGEALLLPAVPPF